MKMIWIFGDYGEIGVVNGLERVRVFGDNKVLKWYEAEYS